MQLKPLVLAGLIAMLPTGVSAKLKPDEIGGRIDKIGASATVAALIAKHKWNRVLGYIGTGKPAWLALAPKLVAGTDASASLGLTIALADALPRNPAGVLDLVRTGKGPLALSQVCAAPFIEPIPADLVTYRRSAKHALDALTDVHLREARKSCLAALGGHGKTAPA